MYDLNRNVTECQYGWEFDKKDYEKTIPSEFNWICDRVHYATDCFTWGNVGNTIGTIGFGILADKSVGSDFHLLLHALPIARLNFRNDLTWQVRTETCIFC